MKTIDAQNQSLGRVASEAAMVLMGKHKADYQPHKITGESVHITNASKLSISEKKKNSKEYTHYTQYPGGLKHSSLKKIIDTKGYEEVVRRAVKRMIPSNRLRDDRLKMLKITD